MIKNNDKKHFCVLFEFAHKGFSHGQENLCVDLSRPNKIKYIKNTKSWDWDLPNSVQAMTAFAYMLAMLCLGWLNKFQIQ